MNSYLNRVKKEIYNNCSLEISKLEIESESEGYGACRFELNGRIVFSRNAKITPKKVGQFVTFWKRNANGPIEPFDTSDEMDFCVVNVKGENTFGQFVFPKSVLIEKGIISTKKKEGKRGFRLYPSWDLAKSTQAKRTQKWQLDYFFEINHSTNFKKVVELYSMK